jgi:HK97 family phage major capsid protein
MSTPDVADAVNKLNAEWVGFKAENDRRLKEIEARGRADPLTEEKVDRYAHAVTDLQRQVDELTMKTNRLPARHQPGKTSEAQEAHAKAFGTYLRKGDTRALEASLEQLRIQGAISVGSDPEGGYAIPETLDTEIEKYERDNTPMRSVCRVLTLANENYSKLVSQPGASSGWVGEQDSRSETNTPTLAELKPYFGEVYANPRMTQKALDDAPALETWLAEEVGIEFGEQENDAFTRGDGNKKPKGFLGVTLSTSADGTRSVGQIQNLNSGSSGNFVADKIIDLVQLLKRGYRNGAVFMASSLGVGAIKKLKDGQNNYLWQPSFQAGQASTLLGYPIVENDDMPDPAAAANALAFGNFMRGYYIVDVQGTRMLRDPYTNKPNVMFYTTKRVGGFVVNDRAIKVLTLS